MQQGSAAAGCSHAVPALPSFVIAQKNASKFTDGEVGSMNPFPDLDSTAEVSLIVHSRCTLCLHAAH